MGKAVKLTAYVDKFFIIPRFTCGKWIWGKGYLICEWRLSEHLGDVPELIMFRYADSEDIFACKLKGDTVYIKI